MPNPTIAFVALLASATAASAPSPAGPAEGSALSQVQFRGQIIIRVPSTPMPAAAPPMGNVAGKPQRYDEKKGPKCIAIGQLGGAIVNKNDLDLVLKGGERLRAKLDGDCGALGYYGGFYIKPSADGQVCAGRDEIRTRSGESCGIKRFHKLVPKRQKP